MGIPRIESVGRYELLLELAKGGMAELYLARLHGVGGFERVVAIKRILPHLAEDKLFVEMFLNEGRIAAQLLHQNICTVYELGEADGSLFLSMDYLQGMPWDALIRDQPRTPPDNARTLRLVAGVIAQACDGLHHAHELRDADGTPTPIVHRDVSPQNLFVTIDGACKVLDFGVSKMLKDGPRTRTGLLKGKLPYMSPEQIQGEQVDPRSDVFALGVVVWEALAGTSLFDRDTDFLIWKAITEAPIPLLAPHGYPPEIDAVLGAALARDRDQRFRSARALGEALRHAASVVGGAYDDDQIAAALQAACGERIAERSREVAAALTQRRSKPSLEPTAADTIEDEAAATASLRTDDDGAGSTVSLRSEPVRIQREQREQRDAALDRLPTRRRWPFVVGALALIGSLVTVLAVTRGGDDVAPAPAPAPVAEEPVTEPVRVTDRRHQAAPGMTEAIDALETLGEMRPQLEKLRDSVKGIPGATAGWGSASPDPTRPPGKPPSPARPAKATRPKAETVDPARELKTPDELAPDPGSYSVGSEPYATIYIDGKKVGDTPLFQHVLPAGKHMVRAVRSDDGRQQKFLIDVAPGKTVNSGKLTW